VVYLNDSSTAGCSQTWVNIIDQAFSTDYSPSNQQHQYGKYNTCQGKVQSLFKNAGFRHKHPKGRDDKKQ